MLIEALANIVIVAFLICLIPLIAGAGTYLAVRLTTGIRREWEYLRKGY